MAKFLNFALILSLLLFVTMAESRKTAISTVRLLKEKPSLTCEGILSVSNGDTCAAIAKTFDISLSFFVSINPNINCSDLFIGQWVCVIGTGV